MPYDSYPSSFQARFWFIKFQPCGMNDNCVHFKNLVKVIVFEFYNRFYKLMLIRYEKKRLTIFIIANLFIEKSNCKKAFFYRLTLQSGTEYAVGELKILGTLLA